MDTETLSSGRLNVTNVVTSTTSRILVAGGGGFIGHHLVRRLKATGAWVRGVDLKIPVFESSPADEFLTLDLRNYEACSAAVKDIDEVYQLAADMGGIGYITAVHADLARNNVLINSHMLEASRRSSVKRYLFSSSACVYPGYRQSKPERGGLKESDAIPADPEPGYGWEKLFSEQLTTYFGKESGLITRIARFHNIYGPLGTFEGGREKAPAAISRKVAETPDGGTVTVWGDGRQTRSFCYVSDCVEGLIRIMKSDYSGPLNLGSEESVTVRELVELVCDVAGKHLNFVYDKTQPQGVRGRNSDNRLLRETVGWEPQTSLRAGVEQTYPWIWKLLDRLGRAKPPSRAPSLQQLQVRTPQSSPS
ncbi:MAG: NAD-dependent epimerase/dehydratase family protein [Thermoplasmata archaeon]